MSYDLFFAGVKRPTFERYFYERPWWKLRDTESGVQAWYENTDTGVYFSFDCSKDDVAFNLNYFRPHIFGLEAAAEVTAFVQALKPEISDPQHDGMADGPYTEEGFLRGWNAGNAFSHQAAFAQYQPELVTMPRAQLESLWRWNLQRAATTTVVNEIELIDCFVPKIWAASTSRGLRTYVVWDTTFPILLPEVDDVVAAGKNGAAPTVIPVSQLAGALAAYRTRQANETFENGDRTWWLAVPAREVFFDAVPAALAAAAAMHRHPFDGDNLPWDKVHTREVVEQAMNK